MDKIIFNEKVWQPVSDFTLKEEVNPVSKKSTGVIIEGEALDTSQPTRNGVLYDYDAVVSTHKMLEGRPMLLNHDETRLPIGHVEKVWMKGPKMMYRANLDPEEKELIRKIKRKDVQSVSIQTLVEDVSHEEDMQTGKSYTRAYPSDWAELSTVTIPGYADSSMKLAEAWKIKERLSFKEAIELKRLRNLKESGICTNCELEREKGLMSKLTEDVTTANSGALATTALAKIIRTEPEPGNQIKKEKEMFEEEALEILNVVKAIESVTIKEVS